MFILVVTKFSSIAPMLLKENLLCIYEIVIMYEGLVLKCDDIITRLTHSQLLERFKCESK